MSISPTWRHSAILRTTDHTIKFAVNVLRRMNAYRSGIAFPPWTANRWRSRSMPNYAKYARSKLG